LLFKTKAYFVPTIIIEKLSSIFRISVASLLGKNISVKTLPASGARWGAEKWYMLPKANMQIPGLPQNG